MSNTLTDKASRKRSRMIRLTGLIAVLALSTTLGLLHGNKGAAWLPVGVDALCPFGGIETLWAFLAGGALLKRVALSSVILLVGTIGVALVMGRAFCGQICPLGTIQELFSRAGRRLFGRRFAMPRAFDRPARYLKYLVLIAFTLWTWVAAELVMRAYDPWVAYHHLTSAELLTEFSIGLAILVVSLAGSLAYDRFFCKYACPMGAFLSVFNRLSVFRVTRDENVCVDCGACDRACPVNLPVATSTVVTSAECIACSECVTACPAPGALGIASRKGATISPLRLTLVTLAIFFGIAAATTAAGWFGWTQPTFAGEVKKAVESGAPVDTSTIKGSTSMQEIADTTGIPAEELQAQFGLTADEMALPLKEVKAVHGFTMEDVRAYVDDYLPEQ